MADVASLGAPDATYKSLQGKKVLITGGSAGIGKATAESFAANGATVTITGRRMERLEAVLKTLKTKVGCLLPFLLEQKLPAEPLLLP